MAVVVKLRILFYSSAMFIGIPTRDTVSVHILVHVGHSRTLAKFDSETMQHEQVLCEPCGGQFPRYYP